MSQYKGNSHITDSHHRKNLEGIRVLIQRLQLPPSTLLSKILDWQNHFACLDQLYDFVDFSVFPNSLLDRNSEITSLDAMLEQTGTQTFARTSSSTQSLSKPAKENVSTDSQRYTSHNTPEMGDNDRNQTHTENSTSNEKYDCTYPPNFYHQFYQGSSATSAAVKKMHRIKESTLKNSQLLNKFVNDILSEKINYTTAVGCAGKAKEQQTLTMEKTPTQQPGTKINGRIIDKNKVNNLADTSETKDKIMHKTHVFSHAHAEHNLIDNLNKGAASQQKTSSPAHDIRNSILQVQQPTTTASLTLLNRFCDALLSKDTQPKTPESSSLGERNKNSSVPIKRENHAFSQIKKQLGQEEENSNRQNAEIFHDLTMPNQDKPNIIDANDIADLVNDVLVEQALRQGVPLS